MNNYNICVITLLVIALTSGDLGRAKTSRASRTQSQARLNSDEAQPRTVGHNHKRRRVFSPSITLRSCESRSSMKITSDLSSFDATDLKIFRKNC